MVRRIATVALALGLALGPTGSGTALANATAVDDEYPVLEDGSIEIAAPGYLGNDVVTAGNHLCQYSFVPESLHGHLSHGIDGSFTFAPTADYVGDGSDSFVTYTIYEEPTGGFCNTGETVLSSATIRLPVTPVNDAPTLTLIGDCADGHVDLQEDPGPISISCITFDPGPNNESGQTPTWTVQASATMGASSGPTITGTTTGTLNLTPAANDSGTISMTITANDGGGTDNGGVDTSNAVDVTVTVAPVNDAPSATADSFQVLKNTTLNVNAPGVLVNDSDIDSESITAVKVNNPSHGALTLAADGSFSYTPSSGYVGPDAFSYKASDGSLSSPTRVVSIVVTAVPPISTPTPFPTPTLTPIETPLETVAEPSASPDATATIEPSLLPGVTALPTALASPTPGASPAPGSAADGGGVSLPVLLVIVLFVLLVGFGAALYIPKWLAAQRGDPPDLD